MTQDQTQMQAAQTSLSDQHKEAVKTWVPRVRKVIERDLRAQLARLGLRDSGEHAALKKIAPDKKPLRQRVEALLQRETKAEGGLKQGYENVIRELTYTALNRLVGLKAMECRKVLYLPPPQGDGPPEETEVITPVPGQGRSRYLRDFRAAGGSRYKYDDDAEEALLRDGLTAAYRHITQEIRLLFDPDHESACVWPTHACLVSVIGMINSDLPPDAFRAQDFLGWVYQFFNRDEKKRVRAENKGTPRSSYELSVINQFYTPSWVVKALVDNTLGRLWLQMHRDSSLRGEGPPPLPDERTSFVPVADYLVPRTGEDIRYRQETESGEVKEFKRARDITLLDPACGTMHFGQYAFGLFHRMYLEEIEHAGEPGWPAEPSILNARDIPAAIIENNLFGIDIDARAIQIASLSIWITAKEAALTQGMSPTDVVIRRSNLVVANAVSLGEDQLRGLIDHLGSRLGSAELQERLFCTLWENLQHVGELGSLIQVNEGVTDVLRDWVEARAREKGLTDLLPRPIGGKQLQLEGMFDKADEQLELQRRLLEEEARKLQQDLLEAVERAAEEGDPADRLFAEDTARGLKLLQVLSRRFDVVAMNPPYGALVPEVKELVRTSYSDTYHDIYAAFIRRATQLARGSGYVGALVSRTFVAQVTSRKLRERILLKSNPLVAMIDLGVGVLDEATVEAGAIVLLGSERPSDRDCAFFGVERFPPNERHERFVSSLRDDSCHPRIRFDAAHGDFRAIKGVPLAYRRIKIVAPLFRTHPALEPTFGCVRQGAGTAKDSRYVRYWWELLSEAGDPRPFSWKPFAKGGSYCRFYFDVVLRVHWDDTRGTFVGFHGRKGRSQVRPVGASHYFKPGLTWPLAASDFNVRWLPEGCVFGHKGPCIFPDDVHDTAYLAAVLNSELAEYLLRGLTSRQEMGGRWEVGLVKRLPVIEVSAFEREALGEAAQEIHSAKRAWAEGAETATHFSRPWLLKTKSVEDGLSARLDWVAAFEASEETRIQQTYSVLNDSVYRLYGVSEETRSVIKASLGDRPVELLWPQMQRRTLNEKRMEHVWRLLSFVVKRVIEADEDGIVPFIAVSNELSLMDRVHKEVAALFPALDSNQVEVEISNELKRKVKGYKRTTSIQQWVEDVYFKYHVGLYKKRPIFWHIASAQARDKAAFAAVVHYHKFDKDRMKKLRGSYLRDAIRHFRREAGLADQEGRTDDRQDWQAKLEEAQELDKRLRWIQEGLHDLPAEVDCRIRTPWKQEDEQPKGWDPDLDDGVAVNIAPLQRAGVLRISKVI